MSSSRFRDILLREWFGTFKVGFIDDIRDLSWRVRSFNVARFVRYVDMAFCLRRGDMRRGSGGSGGGARGEGGGGVLFTNSKLTHILSLFSLSSQIYFGDSLNLRPEDLSPFTTLQRISYPVSILSPIGDGFYGWPKQLESIELLDVQHDAIVKTCTLLADFFPSVRRLRLNSGTYGAYGPIPSEYRSAAELSVSFLSLLPTEKGSL